MGKDEKGMTLITVDLRSRTPIFEQIVQSVEELVLRGMMKPDEQMPSVRALSSELGINPNTIQKAYAELERRGVIYSAATRGSFVSSDTTALREKSRADALEKMREYMNDAKSKNIEKDEILAIIEQIWGAKQ